nr:immunoglobulin heavy chain junction region [Mus musculus]
SVPEGWALMVTLPTTLTP